MIKKMNNSGITGYDMEMLQTQKAIAHNLKMLNEQLNELNRHLRRIADLKEMERLTTKK